MWQVLGEVLAGIVKQGANKAQTRLQKYPYLLDIFVQ
jgi:hypothetical protein